MSFGGIDINTVKFTSLFLCVILLLGTFSFTAAAESGFAGGNGTEASPYLIENYEDLCLMSRLINSAAGSYAFAYYRLSADIYCNDISDFELWSRPSFSQDGEGAGSDEGWFGQGSVSGKVPENVFTPMGTEEHPFSGHLDGGKYYVVGLYVGTDGAGGLFGVLGGTVSELGIKSAFVSGGNSAGGIAGINSGTVTECFFDGRVTAAGENAGGIAGINSGTVSHCAVYGGKIDASGYAGGIAGSSLGGTVSSCLNTATVESAGVACAVIGDGISAAVNSCVYLSSVGTDSLASAKTDAQLKSGTAISGLSAFTFTAGSYPTLSWNLERSSFSLTVNYKYGDGAKALDSVVIESIPNGQSYSVLSPDIERYSPSVSEVKGKINGKNVEVDVIYKANGTGVYVDTDGAVVCADEITGRLVSGTVTVNGDSFAFVNGLLAPELAVMDINGITMLVRDGKVSTSAAYAYRNGYALYFDENGSLSRASLMIWGSPIKGSVLYYGADVLAGNNIRWEINGSAVSTGNSLVLENVDAGDKVALYVTAPDLSELYAEISVTDKYQGTTAADSFGAGKGTALEPYVAYTAPQLARIALVDTSGKHFILGGNVSIADPDAFKNEIGGGDGDMYAPDIDWDSAKAGGNALWTPIGTEKDPFNGSFNGNGFTVSGIYAKGDGARGLFGAIGENGSVGRVGITDSYVYSSLSSGSVAGKNNGVIYDVWSDARVYGSNAGGIAGLNEGTVVRAHYFGDCTVGITKGGTVENCYKKEAAAGLGTGLSEADSLIAANYTGFDLDNIWTAEKGKTPRLINLYRPKVEITVIPGDASGDGSVDNGDLILIAKYIANWEVTVDAGADANGDGSVDNSDLILIAKKLAGWDVELG